MLWRVVLVLLLSHMLFTLNVLLTNNTHYLCNVELSYYNDYVFIYACRA